MPDNPVPANTPPAGRAHSSPDPSAVAAGADPPAPGADSGLCWTCNYPLRGIESRACPECGRAFDPADPRTLNLGRPVGAVRRWLRRGPGWGPVVVAALAVLLVGWVTRWPTRGWSWTAMDLDFYFPSGQPLWAAVAAACTRPVGAAYVIGLLVAGLATAWWVGRLLLAGLAHGLWPRVGVRRRPHWAVHAVMAVLLGAVVAMINLGWPYRLGQESVDGPRSGAPGGALAAALESRKLPPDCREPILRSAMTQGPTAAGRLAGVRLAVGWRPASFAAGALADALRSEPDPAVKALELRLLGLFREAEYGDDIEAYLGDPSPVLRAAAADALSVLHARPYEEARLNFGNWPAAWQTGLATASTPPIDVTWLVERPHQSQVPMPEARRRRLAGMMTAGPTADERDAAARALVAWPPKGYALRVAEWGVWVPGPAGLAPARGSRPGTTRPAAAAPGPATALAPTTGPAATTAPAPPELAYDGEADIPPFVHRLGDPVTSFAGRLDPAYNVWKPVLHLRASEPLAVDVEVSIARGRPWYVFPRPDDYAVAAVQQRTGRGWRGRPPGTPPALAALDPPARFTALPDARQGYPWLNAPHPRAAGDEIDQMGVRWQSAIVSPTRLPWMTPPDVPADTPRFAWWRRLREVDCSWVSNRGEAERFLYYDGPSLLRLPIDVLPSANVIEYPRLDDASGSFVPEPGRLLPEPGRAPRVTLLVEVSGGQARAARVEVPFRATHPQEFGFHPIPRDTPSLPAEAAILGVLRENGLTKDESGGMLDAWRKEWLETDGRRMLLFLSRRDYDRFCPLRIRPEPTAFVRVGVVWVER